MKETATQHKRRLEKAREKYRQKRNDEDENEKQARLQTYNQYRSKWRSAETTMQRERRLELDRHRHSQQRANQTQEERVARLRSDRHQHSQQRYSESQDQREDRLERERQLRQQRNASIAAFEKAINTFCDKICEICRKRCYASQVTTFTFVDQKPSYLPNELKEKSQLLLCHTCKKRLLQRNSQAPSKAYWNKLDPGPIPQEIEILTQAEQRLISRVIPFVKIVKYDGRFGQYGFKGQAILFAQDLFEVSEKLPQMLPRAPADSGLVVVTEHLDNLNVSRQFSISPSKVYAALQWLVEYNPLYQDVIIDHNIELDQHALVRITQQPSEASPAAAASPAENSIDQQQISLYVSINDVARILSASWNQSTSVIFTSGYAGVQCCAMALANIVRALIIPPSQWNHTTLNQNLIAGDELYAQIHLLTVDQENVVPIAESGYLMIRNFDVIKEDLTMYNKNFFIEYNEDPSLYGCLNDRVNTAGIGMTLNNALTSLFENHVAGILIAEGKSYGVMYHTEKYYFADSHSCGKKGAPAKDSDGKACVVECDTLAELTRICKRATGSRHVQYTLDHIGVQLKNDLVVDLDIAEPLPMQELSPLDLEQQSQALDLQVQTSVMAPIDCVQPVVEDELEVSDNVNEIRRKTRDNIVNTEHELRSEELAWYFLFPYGINGSGEPRDINITPLDYYQQRILGSDSRFQRNDYLFYALSMFEYKRIKATIQACLKKLVGQDGKIEDLHLITKALRGSSAYWRTALNECLAKIRCLGPPTYFLSFSCNDLYWIDMRRALLIADGRPEEDPDSLSTHEVQQLIEKYPVTVSRHFMIRIKALMKYIRSNEQVFGGKVKDFWWRIEFQNRGSPHVHMIVWIEDHPSFDTPEGIERLDQVCSCEMLKEDDEIYELVKKCQTHHHTATCQKNNTTTRCRFNFPRQECNESHIVSHSSDEFIRNGGRICLLRRRKEDQWVNNYNRELLKTWRGNIDIQPCGSNESIAYYVAKYISKSEPAELNTSVAQAIKQIRREESDISRKLFKICMRIMNERQVSACECAFRLCHLNLTESSRQCVFLNTRKPEQRYRMLKFDALGRSTGEFYSNMFHRYENRPHEHPFYNFETMTLTEFAMRFQPHYKKLQAEEEGEDNADRDAYDELPVRQRKTIIKLLDDSEITARSVTAAVRVPYFMAATDPENFYYSLLLQYMPYRSEIELLEGFDSAKEAFKAREENLKQNCAMMDEYRQRDRHLENAFNQIHAFEILDAEPPEMPEETDEFVELIDHRMDDEQFNQGLHAMNLGQREVLNFVTSNILEQMEGSDGRLHLFITGQAGTGKTFLFNLLKNQVNRCYTKSVVRVGALTGVAARLVGGMTLHSMLKLPVQKDGRIVQMPLLTGQYLRHLHLEWKEVEFLFIDEISMVPYEMLCMIDSRLRQLKNSDQLFGGINVLLFGDLMQLPPVRGNAVFKQPEHMEPATHLWQLFTLVELTENMRQQGDTTFIDVLNALRIGQLTANHMSVLLDRVSTETDGEFSIEKALRIYPTNKQVQDHNKKVLEYFRLKGIQIFKIRAQDTLVDTTRPLKDSIDSVIPVDINKTGGLPRELEIFVGAKVMLRSNIDVRKGLVNGAIGFITEIKWGGGYRRGQIYEQDIPDVYMNFAKDGIHLIQPKSIQFPAKGSYGTAERRMLPLVLSWASTSHKMQGTTVDCAVVNLGSKLFAPGQAYVTVSRVRTIDGLRIEELDASKLTGDKPCNTDALAEMERMRRNSVL